MQVKNWVRSIILTAFGGLAVLLALASLSPVRAAGPLIDCTTANFANIVGDPAFMCDEIKLATFPLAGSPVTLRIIRDKNDERSRQYLDLVAAATEHTLSVFSSYPELRFQNLTVLFIDPVRFPSMPNYADTLVLNENECLMRIYTSTVETQATGDAVLEFQNTMAHELFHCVQSKTWPQQVGFGKPDPGNKFYADRAWWVEGTATLMGNVAYESENELTALASTFWATRDKPLTRQPYTSVVFFSWLWHRSPSSVFKLIENMPVVAGEGRQQNSLASVGPDNLSQFVRDYLDGKVRGPGDRATPLLAHPADPADVVSASDTRTYAAIPYTIFYQDVTFVNGNYMFIVQGNRFAHYRRSDQPNSDWMDQGFEATQGMCGDPKTYRFAGMSIGLGGGDVEEFSVKIEKMPGDCAPCMTEPVRDACLMGQWRATNASIGDTVLASSGGSLKEVMVQGITAMRMREDGTQVFGFEKLAIDGVPSAGDFGIFRLLLHGTIDSTWSARDGRIKLCYQKADAVMQTSVLAGMTDPIKISEIIEVGGGSRTQYWDYTCEGNKLFIGGQADTIFFDLQFEKVGPP